MSFGGFFPTLNVEQAKPHVDMILAGEAEYVWKDVIEDLRKNKLKSLYKANRFIDLKDVPFIKKDFFSKDDEFYHIETTRGCPYNCDFCSVTAFYGASFRHRPIDHVIRQPLAINEDNIGVNCIDVFLRLARERRGRDKHTLSRPLSLQGSGELLDLWSADRAFPPFGLEVNCVEAEPIFLDHPIDTTIATSAHGSASVTA